jgi:thymidine phosphorylase
MAPPLPGEVIRTKRDGGTLSRGQIEAFVLGLAAADGPARWADSQIGAMAMAVLLRGMTPAETAALTDAMTHSGRVLQWTAAALDGPVLDKHSTGGVGDKVSLLLAPMLAACGAVVPMISGRGLAHTGGTLDKLQALPGYDVNPDDERLLQTLRAAGCAIVGASADLAPADRRLYAIRDVTATVESLPLITASILSKKRAAGLQALVMDVKVGQGAFATHLADAQALARSLVDVAAAAGLPTVSLVTDMNQVLGRHAGNALEVAESLALLKNATPLAAVPGPDARLLDVTLALGAELLVLGGLQPDLPTARQALRQALDSGAAAERFARMVAALGGPPDVLRDARLPTAPVQRPVPAPRCGVLVAQDVRALGLAVVALGGGRRHPADAVDPRVGLADVCPLGRTLQAGEPLAWVHAATEAAAEAALAAVQAACTLADTPGEMPPLIHDRIHHRFPEHTA